MDTSFRWGLVSLLLWLVLSSCDDPTVAVRSSENHLASLAAQAPLTLVPPFAPETTDYSLTVPNSVTSVALLATPVSSVARVSVPSMTLVEGRNDLPVRVTAEDGSTLDYRVSVLRLPALASDATLAHLTSPGTLVPAFTPGTLSYTMTVDNSVTSLAFDWLASNPDAQVSHSGGPSLPVGTTTFNFQVTPVDPLSAPMVYTVAVTRRPSSDSTLSGLVPSTGTLSPGFSPGVTAYQVSVPNSVTALTLAATPSVGEVVVTGGPGLAVGTNQYTAVVTAPDGSHTTYVVQVLRDLVKSSVCDLAGLSVGSSLSPPFSPNTLSYSAIVTNPTTSLTVVPTLLDPRATATVSGAASLSVGANTVTVVVTAQDGISQKVYSVAVQRLPLNFPALSNNSSLSALKVVDDGTGATLSLSPPFSPAVTDYHLTIANTTTDLAVTATKASAKATTSKVLLPGGTVAASPVDVSNSTYLALSIVVTAEDGSTTTYRVLVARLAAGVTPKSNVSALSALTLSKGTLDQAFSSTRTAYSATLPANTTAVTLTATPKDPTAVVGPVTGTSGLVPGSNLLSVPVTAADGTKTVYTVAAYVPLPLLSDATLATLLVAGAPLTPAFSPGVHSYSATLPAKTTSASVTAVPTDPVASVVIAGQSALVLGTNPVTVEVTSGDGTTKATYSLSLTVPASSDASLASLGLALAGVSQGLTPSFSPATFSYSVTLPSGTTEATVSAAPTDPSAQGVAGTGLKGLVTGTNPLVVTVTAQDGTQKTYTLAVVVPPPPGANSALSSLALTSPALTLTPSFSPSVLSYTATAASGTSAVTVTAGAQNAQATMTGTGSTSLATGTNTLKISVTSADGSTKTVYTVTVTVAAPATAPFSGTAQLTGTLTRGTASPYSTNKQACWVWVTDSAGAYIETLMYYPAPYPGSLGTDMGKVNSWKTANPTKTVPSSAVDAVSAATWKTTAPTRTFHWSFIKADGTKVAQGTYTFHAMLFEDGATGETHYTAQVTLGSSAVSQTFTASTPTHAPGTLASGSVVYVP